MGFSTTQAKSIFSSVTFWGAVISLFSVLAPKLYANVFGSTSQTQIVSDILTGIGFLTTVVGRLRASQPAKLPGSTSTSIWLLAVVLLGGGLTGCSKQAAVEAAIGVYQQVITLAQDDLPALQASGILTAGDVTAAGNWLTGAAALGTQAQTCVAGSGGTASVIVGCINAIGAGLLSPAEQANLRIISPGAQKKVTLYVTAVVLAANGIAAIIKATSVTPPAVGSGPATPASTEEIRDFEHRLPAPSRALIEAYGY